MLFSFVFANQNPRLLTLLALTFEGSFEGSSLSNLPLSLYSPLAPASRSLPTILLSYLESTLIESLVSVARKELIRSLNPLDATLMKIGGGGVMVNQPGDLNPGTSLSSVSSLMGLFVAARLPSGLRPPSLNS